MAWTVSELYMGSCTWSMDIWISTLVHLFMIESSFAHICLVSFVHILRTSIREV
jgi:hypothetical protein